MLIKQKIKAFTMIELLVSMTLSGILVVFAFMGYNQMQKLFVNYSTQSKFISDYNQLNKALFIMANKAKTIEKINEHSLNFKTDSNSVELDIHKETILLKFKSHTDTFHLNVTKTHFDLLAFGNGTPSALVKHFESEIMLQSQKFRISFHKDYDAASTLDATLVLLPIKE